MVRALHAGASGIEVRLRHHARARRMVLRVGQAGEHPATLTLPPGVPLAAAEAFLRDQQDWLRHQIARGPVRVAVGPETDVPFGDGSLRVRQVPGRRLRHEAGVLHVPGPARMVPGRVAGFLRESARAACADGVAFHAARLGRTPGRISLRDPRSRWGSCTSRGDLMFSWRLAMAPAQVLDYVVAHEVAHLAEMNHSTRFWAVVADLCPDNAGPRDWLRRHGASLHAFDFASGAGA